MVFLTSDLPVQVEKEDEEVEKKQVIVGSVTVAIKKNLWRTNKNEGFMCDCYSYVKIKGDAHIACVVQF